MTIDRHLRRRGKSKKLVSTTRPVEIPRIRITRDRINRASDRGAADRVLSIVGIVGAANAHDLRYVLARHDPHLESARVNNGRESESSTTRARGQRYFHEISGKKKITRDISSTRTTTDACLSPASELISFSLLSILPLSSFSFSSNHS